MFATDRGESADNSTQLLQSCCHCTNGRNSASSICATFLFFFFFFFSSIQQLEKFGVDWAKSVMFERKTGLWGHDPGGCTLQKWVIKPVRKDTVGSCSCMWLDQNSDQVCSLQSGDMLHTLKNSLTLASIYCKSSFSQYYLELLSTIVLIGDIRIQTTHINLLAWL